MSPTNQSKEALKTLLDLGGYFMHQAGLDHVDMFGTPVVVPNMGREQLAETFRMLGFTKGAEIGVKRGEYSEVLLKANPELKLYGIDPYQGYEAYRTISQQQQTECRATALERLTSYLEAGRYALIEKLSVDAARDFSDGELDFVFIDASHKFEDVIADISVWSRVVRPGGVISGHDFLHRKLGRGGGPNTSHHVVTAVTAYTKAYSIDPWYVLGKKHAPAGEIRDKERSYLWVNR